MKENEFKVMMIGNIIVDSVFFICVTAAAIYFRKPSILAWYLLKTVSFYHNKPTKERDENA